MAGPFSSANTAVDIPTGGIMAAQAIPEVHAPAMPSAIADAAALVNAIAPPVNAIMGEHYKQQMTQELKGVEAALAASRRPWAMDSLLSDEAAKDPIVSSAVKELKGMQVAVRRGQMPVDFAVDRMEQIISTAVSKVPAYEEELREAGRNYLGFDPHQRMLSDMMQPNVQEQADQADAVAAAKIGMDINSYRQAKMQMFQLEFQKKAVDYQIASMNLQAKPMQLAREEARFGHEVQEWQRSDIEWRRSDVEWHQKQVGGLVIQHSQLESSSITAQLLEGMQAEITKGGIQNPEAWKNRASQAYNALLSAELSRLPPGSDAAGVTAFINQQREMALSLIDSAAAGKITQNENQYLQELAKNNLYRLPKLGPVLAGLGPQQAPLVMATLARLSKAGSGGYESVLTGGGEAGGVLTLAELLDAGAIERNMEGAVNYHYRGGSTDRMPESTRRVGIMLGIERLGTPGSTGTDYADGVEKLRELASVNGGDADEYYYAMVRPSVVANVSNSKETHGALLNTFTDDQAAVVQKYLSLVSSGLIPGGSISLRNGEVVFPHNSTIQADTQKSLLQLSDGGYVQPEIPAGIGEAERLASHINKMLKFGDTYRSTGVIPASVYNGREDFVGKLLAAEQQMKATQEAVKAQQATAEQQQQQAPVVIKYQYVDGKLQRVSQEVEQQRQKAPASAKWKYENGKFVRVTQ